MKCQKCGAQMVSGHLYCDICGAEYQIVPDFEPEIENSIAQSLSDITETMEKNIHETERKKVSVKKKIKVPSFTLIFFVVMICSVFIFIGYSKYTNSDSYQSKMALNAINSQDYYKAAQIYERLRKENPEMADWYIKEAETKLLLGKNVEAYQLAVAAIQLEETTEEAYLFLLPFLEKEENYIEMYQLLKECEFVVVKEKYREYLCELPDINYESGNYDTSLDISFEKGFQGTIYYTLDGSVPNLQSAKYEKPIKLGNGTHILTAIYANAHGMLSEPQSWNYQITSEKPMAPVVKLSSGKYKYAEMIEVSVEEGTKVYYTTDLSHPTEESLEYTMPIPMPLGESRFNFVAISEKGISSGITQRNYMLNMKTNVSIEEAETMLVQKLISTGHILDQNGAVQDRYGVFRYFYKFPISETEQNYYVFEEHYMENQINNPLGHFYAIDVLYGQVYKVIKDDTGKFIRVDF